MLLVFTALLVRPTLEVVFFPSTCPVPGLMFAIDFNLLRLGMRTEAHAAAQMALGEAILIPVRRRNRRIRPLHAMSVAVTRLFAGFP